MMPKMWRFLMFAVLCQTVGGISYPTETLFASAAHKCCVPVTHGTFLGISCCFCISVCVRISTLFHCNLKSCLSLSL